MHLLAKNQPATMSLIDANETAINAMTALSSLHLAAKKFEESIREMNSSKANDAMDILEKNQVFIPTEIMTVFRFHYGNCVYGIASDKKNQNPITKTYLVQNSTTGLYKIGRTTQPDISTRISQFEGMSGGDICLIDYVDKDIEKELHKLFKKKRVKGEWFNLKKSDVNGILERFSLIKSAIKSSTAA